jgi:hypothetical protein
VVAQRREFALDLLGAAVDVAHLAVAGSEPEGPPLAVAADQDRGSGLLHGRGGRFAPGGSKVVGPHKKRDYGIIASSIRAVSSNISMHSLTAPNSQPQAPNSSSFQPAPMPAMARP